MLRVVDEVASGAELAVFVLMEIPAHFLSKDRLMLYKFLHSVGEEAIGPIGAIACLAIALAKLQFSLLWEVGCSFIIYQIGTHVQ
jgi:hypothetical protein